MIVVQCGVVCIIISSCAVGVGIQSINPGVFSKNKKKYVYDVEYISQHNIFKTPEHFNINYALSCSYTQIFNEGKKGRYSDKVSMYIVDFRIPLRMSYVKTKKIIPHFGTGLGYYLLRSDVSSLGNYVYSDWNWDYYEIEDKYKTYSSGIYPFIEGGISIAITKSKNYYLRLAYKKDFLKKNSGYDLSGDQLLFSVIIYDR